MGEILAAITFMRTISTSAGSEVRALYIENAAFKAACIFPFKDDNCFTKIALRKRVYTISTTFHQIYNDNISMYLRKNYQISKLKRTIS